MPDYESEHTKQPKIFQLFPLVIEVRKLVRVLIQQNHLLLKENHRLKEMLGTKIEPERVKELERELERLKEREEKVRKKIKRLVVKLEKLELLDKDFEEEVPEVESEESGEENG